MSFTKPRTLHRAPNQKFNQLSPLQNSSAKTQVFRKRTAQIFVTAFFALLCLACSPYLLAAEAGELKKALRQGTFTLPGNAPKATKQEAAADITSVLKDDNFRSRSVMTAVIYYKVFAVADGYRPRIDALIKDFEKRHTAFEYLLHFATLKSWEQNKADQQYVSEHIQNHLLSDRAIRLATESGEGLGQPLQQGLQALWLIGHDDLIAQYLKKHAGSMAAFKKKYPMRTVKQNQPGGVVVEISEYIGPKPSLTAQLRNEIDSEVVMICTYLKRLSKLRGQIKQMQNPQALQALARHHLTEPIPSFDQIGSLFPATWTTVAMIKQSDDRKARGRGMRQALEKALEALQKQDGLTAENREAQGQAYKIKALRWIRDHADDLTASEYKLLQKLGQ